MPLASKSDPKGAVTRDKFFCKLQRNGIARQVPDEIVCETSPLHKIHVPQRKIALRVAGKVDWTSAFCNVASQRVTFISATCLAMLLSSVAVLVSRKITSCNSALITTIIMTTIIIIIIIMIIIIIIIIITIIIIIIIGFIGVCTS